MARENFATTALSRSLSCTCFPGGASTWCTCPMEPTLDLDSLQRAVDALRVQESVQQERQQLETMKAAVDGNIE